MLFRHIPVFRQSIFVSMNTAYGQPPLGDIVSRTLLKLNLTPGYFSGTEATGAHIKHLGGAVHDRVNTLHVRRPCPLCFAVGMTYGVAGSDSLIAYFTVLCHTHQPLRQKSSSVYFITALQGWQDQFFKFSLHFP